MPFAVNRLASLFLAIMLLSACSQGAQTLRLNPEPPVTGPVTGDQRDVALEVVDTRTDRDLGMLENPDGSIVRLLPAQDLAYGIQLAAAQALRGYALTPSLWDTNREPRLSIRIETLEHQVKAGLPYQLETEVALQVIAWADGQRYSSRTRTLLTNPKALPPSAATNTLAIETAITRALGQLLDKELAEFLRGQTN